MRCTDCDGPHVKLARSTGVRLRGVVPRIGRLTLLYCEQCGSAVAPPDPTDTLLAKLAQLARFGLAAEAMPILSNGERRGPESGAGG